LHLLYQSCGRQDNCSFDNLASLKVFVLQRLGDILGLVIYLKVKKWNCKYGCIFMSWM